MNKKESIIHYFEQMDIGMLGVLLDDAKTYQNTPKVFFLMKLDLVFLAFKKNKDTFLKSFRGKCCLKECPNVGCKGFSFVGNVSGLHIDLIFEDSDDDYVDIYQCNGFETQRKTDNKSGFLTLDIKFDEQDDFKPDIDFLIKSQKCRNAFEELSTAGDTNTIDPEFYLNWLEKHLELYNSFDYPPIFHRDYEKFYILYFSVNYLASFMSLDTGARKAIDAYLLLSPDDEIKLLSWLSRFEKLGKQLMSFPFPDAPSAKEIEKGYFMIEGIHINAADYENIIQFIKIFNKYYWDMLEKYKTNIEVKADDLSEVLSITESDASLTYYLRKRGVIGF